MKTGKTLVELAQELERQREHKHDYIARGEALEMIGGALVMTNGDIKQYNLTPLAHTQTGERLGIPKKYYDYLKDNQPDMLDYNVTQLLHRKPQTHLVRTLDDKARAILSDRFRCLDNAPFLETVLPPLMEAEFQIASCEVTDTRFYLKVVSDKLTADVAVGDPVRAGFWFRNSEVGHSRLAGGLFIERLVCTNGLIMPKEYGFAKNHSGKAIDFSEAVEAYFSHETRALDDATYWAKLKDVVQGMIADDGGFKAAVLKIGEASKEKITGDPVKAVEKVTEIFALNQAEGSGVLRHLIEGGDLSRWGVTNALTRYSQDIDDYDRATDFETFGGKVIDLSSKDWTTIATA